MRRRIAAGAIVSVLFAACAAEQKPPSAPQDVTPSNVTGQPAGPDEPPAVVRARAKNELKQAEIELGQAGSDCSRACKALASMERATAHLCSVSGPDDQQSCDDARQKLQSSRDRVRGACGECQH